MNDQNKEKSKKKKIKTDRCNYEVYGEGNLEDAVGINKKWMTEKIKLALNSATKILRVGIKFMIKI